MGHIPLGYDIEIPHIDHQIGSDGISPGAPFGAFIVVKGKFRILSGIMVALFCGIENGGIFRYHDGSRAAAAHNNGQCAFKRILFVGIRHKIGIVLHQRLIQILDGFAVLGAHGVGDILCGGNRVKIHAVRQEGFPVDRCRILQIGVQCAADRDGFVHKFLDHVPQRFFLGKLLLHRIRRQAVDARIDGGVLVLEGDRAGEGLHKLTLRRSLAQIQAVFGDINRLQVRIGSGGVELFQTQAAQIDLCQSFTAAEIDLPQVFASAQIRNGGGKRTAAEIQPGHAGEKVQAGEILHLCAGEIQCPGEIRKLIQIRAGLPHDFCAQNRIGNFLFCDDAFSTRDQGLTVIQQDGGIGLVAGKVLCDNAQCAVFGQTEIHRGGSSGDSAALEVGYRLAVQGYMQLIPVHGIGIQQTHRGFFGEDHILRRDRLGITVVRPAAVADRLAPVISADGINFQIVLVAFLHGKRHYRRGGVAVLQRIGISLVVGIAGRNIAQGDFKFVAVGSTVRGSLEGDLQLSGGGGPRQQAAGGFAFLHLDVADLIAVGIGQCGGIAFRTVRAYGAQLQINVRFLVKYGFYIQNVVINAAQIDALAVREGAIDIILLDFGIVCQIPFEDHFTGGISIVDLKSGGGGGLVRAVGDFQAAHVHLIVISCSLKFQGDGRDRSSRIAGKIQLNGLPVPRGLGSGNFHLFGGLRGILEDQAQLHGDRVV